MFRQLHLMAAGDLRLFGLIFFFTIFVAVLLRSFVLRRQGDFESLARLPLDEDHASGKEQAP
jgi:cbb3-type cytochrome oxidase subunit 3